MPKHGGPKPPTEFLEDAAVREAEQDRLGHIALADELLKLVTTVPTPATIGLFGSWGSGKSGIGQLLRQRLAEYNPTHHYVRVDAFRHEGLALSREFIREVAEALGTANSQDIQKLNATTQTSRKVVQLGWRGWLILVASTSAVLTIAATLLTWSAIVNVTSTQTIWQAISAKAPQLLPVILPGALIGAIVAIFGRQLSVDVKTDPAKEPDEFGQAYRRIVAKAKGRVVVFIDELDRCSATQVVSTLDTLRTFLGVDNCVYVVAVDQQVVERAASLASSQVTPHEPQNPYHGAGSAYIDKVFQYRVQVPPVRARRVVRFAGDMIAPLGGVWDEFDKRALAQVLVPTHVRSPRRVKALVNTFTVSYRLLKQRAAQQYLSIEQAPARAMELAKLVALRVEFPLFAEDLARHPELTNLILEMSEGKAKENFLGYSLQILALAEQYAMRRLPLDQNLAKDDAEDTDVAQQVQGDQLLAYLRKTRAIPGPREDLIYLEDAGIAFGLPGDIAEQLEDVAANGQNAELKSLISQLDPDARLSSVRLLVTQLKSIDSGVESSNFITALSIALDSITLDQLKDVAPETMQSLSNWKASDMPKGTSASLLRVAAYAGPIGQPLVEQILGQENIFLETDITPVGLLALPGVSDKEGVVRAIAGHLLKDELERVRHNLEELSAMPVSALASLSTRLLDQLQQIVSEAQTRRRASTSEQRPPSATSTPAGADKPADLDEVVWMRELVGISDVCRGPLQEAILAAALSIDDKKSGRLAIEALPTSVESIELANAIVKKIKGEYVRVWPSRLQHIKVVLSDSILDNLDRQAVADACSLNEDLTPNEFMAALDAIAQLRSDRLRVLDLSDNFVADLQSGDGSLEKTTRAINAVGSCVSAMQTGRVSPVASARLTSVLRELLAVTPEGEMSGLVEVWQDALGAAEVWRQYVSGESCLSLINAAASSPWLSEPTSTIFALKLVSKAESMAELPSVTSLAAVRDVVQEFPEAASEIVALWIEAKGEAEGAYELLRAAPGSTKSERIVEAIRRRALAEREFRLKLGKELAVGSVDDEVRPEILEALELQRVPVDLLVAWILEAYLLATTVDQRSRVLRLWECLSITSRNALNQLIDAVFLPVARSGKGGLRAAAKNVHLIARAGAQAKVRAREELLDLASKADRDLQRMVEQQLEQAGLVNRRRGLKGLLGGGLEKPEISD
ncbi:KAP family P-loop NTPase fold protein [Micromonospora sp. L32]|uniref:KAP family P-loop NTPase fold protein n=1 Tax=Micromonospora sp. L32 TaxID=3452214 RepID=UPI003F88699F